MAFYCFQIIGWNSQIITFDQNGREAENNHAVQIKHQRKIGKAKNKKLKVLDLVVVVVDGNYEYEAIKFSFLASKEDIRKES